MPLTFADQLYVLREHVELVRARFDAQDPAVTPRACVSSA